MKRYFPILLILLVASVLRFIVLPSFPAGLNADEAALGYNAYSLLLTGKDEHAHILPVNLESFADFKPALYAYLLVPFVKVLGLTEMAVRLPSAVFSIIGVFALYVLISRLHSRRLALISSLLLAISPWALHFSRGGWEVNVATTLMLLGATFIVRRQLLFSILCFVLSMYTYQSTRVVAPLLGISLFVIFCRDLFNRPLKILAYFLFTVLLLFPLGVSVFRTSAASRLTGVGLLADEGPLNRAKELRSQHRIWNSLPSKLLHNRPVLYTIQFIVNYTDHFNGNFLFVNGDVIERNRVPETGLMYLTDVFFLFIGAVVLLRLRRSPLPAVVWTWLLIAPVASAMTFQTPHALRAHSLVIPLIIIVSLGVYRLLAVKRFRLLVILGLVVIYSWQLARYLHQYYIHYPQTYPAAWSYGFKQLVPYVEAIKDHYQQVLVTDKYDQPYILFLFYSRFPPQLFQANHQLTVRDRFNFSTVREYDKYKFSSTPWDKVRDIHSALIVAAPEDIPSVGVNIVQTIYFPSGQPAFKIVSN